jgi:hypothetical protein
MTSYGHSMAKIMTREVQAAAGPRSLLTDMGRGHDINRMGVTEPAGCK